MPVKDLQKVGTDLDRAIEWVAVEYKYLKVLQEDLARLEKEEPDQQKRDIKKALRIYRYVGRSERRASRPEKALNKDMVQFLSRLKNPDEQARLIEIKSEIEVAVQVLELNCSMFAGKLKKELKQIRTEIDLEKKYVGNEKVKEQATLFIKKSEQHVKNLIMWSAALEELLKELKIKFGGSDFTMTSLSEIKVSFFGFHPGDAQNVVLPTQTWLLFGRDARKEKNQVTLLFYTRDGVRMEDSRYISRQHFKIMWTENEEDRALITNKNKNGTYLNGKVFTALTELSNGDKISLSPLDARPNVIIQVKLDKNPWQASFTAQYIS